MKQTSIKIIAVIAFVVALRVGIALAAQTNQWLATTNCTIMDNSVSWYCTNKLVLETSMDIPEEYHLTIRSATKPLVLETNGAWVVIFNGPK